MKNKQETAADILRDIFADGKEYTSAELKPKVQKAMESRGFTGFHTSWYANGLAILVHGGKVKRDGHVLKATPLLLTSIAEQNTEMAEAPSNDDIPHPMEQGPTMY